MQPLTQIKAYWTAGWYAIVHASVAHKWELLPELQPAKASEIGANLRERPWSRNCTVNINMGLPLLFRV